MTMAVDSTTGESEKARPASGTRGEENHFDIAGERSDDFRYGSPILCSLLDSQFVALVKKSMLCLSQQLETY